MAKKKATHHSKQHQEQTQQNLDQNDNIAATTPAMDDPLEKLKSLKALNSLLLKETHQRRLQVDSLVQSKKDLESELTRSSMDKEEMNAELTRLSEENVGLELEKGLVGVFVGKHMSEMVEERAEIVIKMEGLRREKEEVRREKEVEIGVLKKKVNDLMGDIEKEREISMCIMSERDELKGKLGVQIGEANGLKQKFVKMEERERSSIDEAKKIKLELEAMLKEKLERESEMKLLVKKKDLAEKRLVEALSLSEILKRENEDIVKEKNEIEKERNGQVVKIKNLEKELTQSDGIVLVLRDEGSRLRGRVLQLEKSKAAAVEKNERISMEFNVLQEQNKESKRKIEKLLEEKTLAMRSLAELEEELEKQKQKIDGIIHEKSEIEKVKAKQELEIRELQEEVDKLRNVVLTLQDKCKGQEEENKQLESDITRYRDVIERVKLEKDDLEKSLKEKEKKGIELRSRVAEIEKKLEESLEEIVEMKSEREKLNKENKDWGSQYEMLIEENGELKKSLLDSQQELNDVRVRLESECTNSKSVLTMLRNTAALAYKSKNVKDEKEDLFTNDQKIEEVQPYFDELESIKNAFRSKETKEEELKRQLEFMQNSVAEANKKKNLWTLMSSATTIFVAASVAYVARGR